MTDAARYGPECFHRVMGMDNDMLSTATFMRTWRASVPEKEKHRMASFWQGGGRVDDQLEDEWRCLRSNWDYIVDAARYGQYFFGTRQGSFFDGYNGVDLRKHNLTWSKDSKSRNVPWWNGTKVFNFHVHGKNMDSVKPGFPRPPPDPASPTEEWLLGRV